MLLNTRKQRDPHASTYRCSSSGDSHPCAQDTYSQIPRFALQEVSAAHYKSIAVTRRQALRIEQCRGLYRERTCVSAVNQADITKDIRFINYNNKVNIVVCVSPRCLLIAMCLPMLYTPEKKKSSEPSYYSIKLAQLVRRTVRNWQYLCGLYYMSMATCPYFKVLQFPKLHGTLSAEVLFTVSVT